MKFLRPALRVHCLWRCLEEGEIRRHPREVGSSKTQRTDAQRLPHHDKHNQEAHRLFIRLLWVSFSSPPSPLRPCLLPTGVTPPARLSTHTAHRAEAMRGLGWVPFCARQEREAHAKPYISVVLFWRALPPAPRAHTPRPLLSCLDLTHPATARHEPLFSSCLLCGGAACFCRRPLLLACMPASPQSVAAHEL